MIIKTKALSALVAKGALVFITNSKSNRLEIESKTYIKS